MNLTEKERQWLNSHPQIRWGADPRWPPFSSFNRRGEFEGIDVDITRIVAERVGVRLTLVRAASWSEVFEKAKAGEIDFLSATARSPDRQELFAYSDDYGAFPVVIITRDTGPFLTSAVALKSLSIAAARDHVTTVRLQRDFPTARLVLTDTVEDAVKLVATGRADATVQNLAVATSVIRLNGLTNLKISGVTQYEFPLHFAVRKDAPELVSILNKGLATVTRQEQELIYAAHLTPDIAKARNWGAWHRRTLYSLAIGLPIIVAVILWNRHLAHQIRLRKTAESALQEARDRLEQRTQQLDLRVAEVERLNLDLQTVNQELKAFSSAASHDLRAPLRRTNTIVQLVCKNAENRLTTESREWLEVVVNEAKRMDRLIEGLLAFARLGHVELRKQPVDMKQLVDDTIDNVRPQLQSRKVLWTVGALGKVFGDPNLLRNALANLIDNALKYTNRCEETRITIDVSADGSGKGQAVFYVKDNGCGFDSSKAGSLFTPFQRLHSAADYEGSGIGLANVKNIIQRHDGRIWCESEPNKGATFYFALPIVPQDSEKQASQPQAV